MSDTGFTFRLEHLALASAIAAVLIVGSYVATAYEFVPMAWQLVERRHPALDTISTRAFTAAGIPGDPLNVAFVGAEAALQRQMLAAGWYPADPITLRSSLHIARASLLHKPYPDAPVSDLFVNGARQQLAFEQAEGGNPSKRHHVRFWRAATSDALGRPLWVGAATFDASVGFSRTTGQVTHHIAAEVDHERDKLVTDLHRGGGLAFKWIEDFQPLHDGRNGGGDRFVTDGRLAVIEVP